MSSLSIATLAALCGDVFALGLGRLNVQSALGEPLRAEIEISSLAPDEASSLQLRVAPAEAYRAAGVEYNAALSATRVTLARRADGRAYLLLAGDRSVSEPFIDVILEITWASGRLVREFTLLLDPPRTAAPAPAVPAPAPAAAPVTAPVVAAAAPDAAAPAAPPPPTPAPAPAPAAAKAAPVAPAASAPRRAPAPPRAVAAAASAAAPQAAGANEIRVRKGDTLSAIAARTQPPGISLDQMLVSLFRGNPQAFVGANMNRLRAGAVLTVPAAEALREVPRGEAREVIKAQSADFDAYRRRLASGVPAAAEGPSRQASGKVQAAVEDRKQAAAPTPDKLKLSQGAVKTAAPEAKISKDSAAKEAATRVAELSRNLEELKKLQGAAATAAPAPAPAAKPAAAAAPAAPAAPVVVAAAPAAAASAALVLPAVVAAPVVAASVPVTPAVPASAPLPAAKPAAVAAAPASAASARAAAPAVPAAAKADEPGWLDSLMDSPFVLPGAGVLALALAGAGLYRVRGRLRKAGGETSFLESRLQPDSFFGASGGQRVDTHDAGAPASTTAGASSMNYSMSQLDAIGDVDPVAEADVYLAYGRDLQAEEILKEAMRATPERLAIRSKLLEVYAKRRDGKGFELLATQLYALTSGRGEEWTKAQELGRSIDPENPLYQPGGEPDAVVHDGDRIIEPLGASTLPQSVMPSPSGFPTNPGALDEAPSASAELDIDLDLDLGFDDAAPMIRPQATAMPEQTQPFASAAVLSAQADPDDASMIELPGLDEAPTNPFEATAPPVVAPPAGSDGLDFDLGDISLDLGTPPSKASAAVKTDAPSVGAFGHSKRDSKFVDFDLPDAPDSRFNDNADPLERKLELADEFRQIGDLDGARDLLEEVIAQAEGSLRARAESMLGGLD